MEENNDGECVEDLELQSINLACGMSKDAFLFNIMFFYLFVYVFQITC